MLSNSAPSFKWFRFEMSDSVIRSKLYVNGHETRFFIDEARTIGHRCYGEKYGLHGAGMGAEIRRTDGTSYQIAATLGFGPRMAPLKADAERRATA